MNDLSKIKVKKILIVFLSGIGNFVLFTPTLRAIRNKFRNAEITLLVKQKVNAEFIDGEGLVDSIVQSYSGDSLLGGVCDQASLIYRERKKNYDLVITTFDARGWKLALFIKLIAAKYSVGYKGEMWYDRFYDELLNDDPAIHEIERHMKIAEFLDIKGDAELLNISMGRAERDFAKSVIPRNSSMIVGMHPGSSEYLARKRWMPGRFAELADYLVEHYGAEILILGGPGEVRLAEEVAENMNTIKPVILAGKTNVRQVAAIIEKCSLFISNDSGLMHIASAVNTPVVAIFGPTDPVKNAPVGNDNIVVRKGVPCSPCFKYIENGCNDLICLEELSVQDVINAVETKLASMGVDKKDSTVTI